MQIPYADIDTIFLDAGNTLISMDFDWIIHELAELGLRCDLDSLSRAEAAARPAASKLALANRGAEDTFRHYLYEVLKNLPDRLSRPRIEALAAALGPRLKRPGQDYKLWCRLLPGADRALTVLRSLGLRLAVVSNSDGSVERALSGLGVMRHLEAVFDSEIVGFEKPDTRFFAHALEQLRAEPSRTVHVGDMYHQDVVGSRQAGLHSVLLDPYDDWAVDDCVVCADLMELAQRLVAARGGTA